MIDLVPIGPYSSNRHPLYLHRGSKAAESSIAGKETKKELDEQDLETTETSIEQKMNNLQTAADLLDKALEEYIWPSGGQGSNI